MAFSVACRRSALVAVLLCISLASAPAAEPATLKAGDMVAFVGNTFVEREQRDGYIELALLTAAPQQSLTFRNLGWSGDTVDGRARRFFGKTPEGFQHLIDHLQVVKPSVIFVCYGVNEAFEGKAGEELFRTGYPKLLDELSKFTPRIVLLSSPPLNVSHTPDPQLARQVNDRLAQQSQFLKQLAEERSLTFVDLFTRFQELYKQQSPSETYTTNGMHLTPRGYQKAAEFILDGLNLPKQPLDTVITIRPGVPADQAIEELRHLIIAKNELFFHRHRPENETYLRGFRKHEQGNNATEIYEFDQLVTQKDQEIIKRAQQVSAGLHADPGIQEEPAGLRRAVPNK